jgi:hypothetical protein
MLVFVQNDIINKKEALNGSLNRIFYPCKQTRGKKHDWIFLVTGNIKLPYSTRIGYCKD